MYTTAYLGKSRNILILDLLAAQMSDAVEDVKAMLGGAKISLKEIEDAVYYYYFDVDKAASYLIGK